LGERVLQLTTPAGTKTSIVLNVMPALDQLIAARLKFIVEHHYCALGGEKYYAIGLSVYDGLTALKKAGRMADHSKLLALFERHARRIEVFGPRYHEMEVNYQQSIVAPPTVFLPEMHRATGEARWLSAAKPHLALLDLFNGRQPDHHLNDVAIRTGTATGSENGCCLVTPSRITGARSRSSPSIKRNCRCSRPTDAHPLPMCSRSPSMASTRAWPIPMPTTRTGHWYTRCRCAIREPAAAILRI
jgi:hypothetical protein